MCASVIKPVFLRLSTVYFSLFVGDYSTAPLSSRSLDQNPGSELNVRSQPPEASHTHNFALRGDKKQSPVNKQKRSGKNVPNGTEIWKNILHL